jgi:DedD protein
VTEADSLEIKKRARRRLVGAIALALLAAIVLPMMMDEEPHPSIEDIQVSIPDRDKAVAARRASAPESASAPVAVAVPEDDEVVAAEKPAPEKVPAAPDKPASAAAPAKPATQPAPATPPAAATPPRPPAPAATPEPRRPSADEEARLRALIEGKASPARGDTYVLQIGAFSDAGKAAKLVDDLRARGFSAYTERAGNVTRVRVGPVAGRAEADATAARLKSAGHAAVLQAR